MRTEQEIFELIENYLSGDLSPLDKISVEEKILNDPSFAEQFESQKMANEVIHYAGLSHLRESIGKDIQNIPHNKTSTISKKWLFIGALGLVASGIGYYAIKNNEVGRQELKIAIKKEELPTHKLEKQVERTVIQDKSVSIDKKENKLTSATKNKTQKEIKIKEEEILFEINEDLEISNIKELPIIAEAPPLPKQIPGLVCNDLIEFKSFASCKNEREGKIQLIEAPKGSLFELISENQSNKLGIFNYLEAKTYTILTKTPTGCSYKNEMKVEEKWCSTNSSFSFNPMYGDVWNINYDSNDKGKYQIFDNQGRLIKSGEFGEENIGWNGKNSEGNSVSNGVYQAIINYADGRMEKIQITILAN